VLETVARERRDKAAPAAPSAQAAAVSEDDIKATGSAGLVSALSAAMKQAGSLFSMHASRKTPGLPSRLRACGILACRVSSAVRCADAAAGPAGLCGPSWSIAPHVGVWLRLVPRW